MTIPTDQLFLIIGNNTLLDYLGSGFNFLLLSGLFTVLKYVLERFGTNKDSRMSRALESLRPVYIYLIAFYLATMGLDLNIVVRSFMNGLVLAVLILQSVRIVQVMIEYLVRNLMGTSDKGETDSTVQAIGLISKLGLWLIGLLLFLSNMGVDVTSLIAGMGIGGIAIAFAVQGILSDLFSSFTIYVDKPFKIGDFIVVGDKAGVVEKVGIKNSRIRALQGEVVVIPNKDLTSNHIQNFKQMRRRRVVLELSLSFTTPIKKLKAIPSLIETIITDTDNTQFDRAHFKSFGPYAFIVEAVYHVTDRDFNLYMDTQEKINLAILEALHNRKIALAYPTQEIKLKKV